MIKFNKNHIFKHKTGKKIKKRKEKLNAQLKKVMDYYKTTRARRSFLIKLEKKTRRKKKGEKIKCPIQKTMGLL